MARPRILNPVPGGKFTNDWGSPRSGGRGHEGTDIFAKSGTPVHAVVGGTITAAGDDGGKGGLRIWINGVFYFAHLKGLAKGIREGAKVKAGQVIGYVGNSGNARNTPSHLHFGWDPSGSQSANGWSNPYPLLTKAAPTASAPKQKPEEQQAVAEMGEEFEQQVARVDIAGAQTPLSPDPGPVTLGPIGSADPTPTQPLQTETLGSTWQLISSQPGASQESLRYAELAALADQGV